MIATEALPGPTAIEARGEIRRGFLAAMPFWFGLIPFAFAFAVLARTSGLSEIETQALSMLVFAGSAQLAFVNLVNEGAGSAAILLTVLLLNLRHVLYGLSLNPYLPAKPKPPRPVLAAGLVDESYGLAIRAFRDSTGSAGYLFGVSLSLFVCFAISTLAGAMLGSRLPDADRLGLEVIFPLSFLALLLPLVRSRIDLTVAAVGGMVAWITSRFADGGVVVLVTTIVAASLGTALETREIREPRR